MSLQIVPRKGETKARARIRVKFYLDASISALEKAIGPLDTDSDDYDTLKKCLDEMDSIYADEFDK